MNYSRAIFLISDDVRVIECTYEAEENAPRTAFKSLDASIKEGDYVVVPTKSRHQMTVCKVAATDAEPDLESSKDIDWIVGVVSRANFEEITRQENEAIDRIRAAERRRKKKELRATMLADAEEEIKALPIATAQIAATASEAEDK
ncbi:MAG: hypothetical protein QNJ62_04985 [Methyloceanibacter sp.]|nr:hypothetical protein [Methyloceanibacter sp.]